MAHHNRELRSKILLSNEKLLISLMISAPFSTAHFATEDLVVSIEIKMSELYSLIFFKTGITLSNSISAVIGNDPGLVDSPPMSRMSAPSAINALVSQLDLDQNIAPIAKRIWGNI